MQEIVFPAFSGEGVLELYHELLKDFNDSELALDCLFTSVAVTTNEHGWNFSVQHFGKYVS